MDAATQRLRLAEGLELLGQYQDGGTIEPVYLLRRSDGSMLVVSRLLYFIVSAVDGHRSLAEIADWVSAAGERDLAPGDVAYLVEHKLQPIGVLAGAGPRHRPPPALTALMLRTALVPERAVRVVAARCKRLFAPPVVAAVLVALAAVDAWLLATRPRLPSVADLLADPASTFAVVALTVLGGAVHELGHAAAASYGGAAPGPIGIGLYLVWPVFFSDQTDSYRLNRAGRIRADLGGVYFNAILMVLLAAAYGLTGWAVILLVVGLHHVLVVRQFLPFLRLDGYYLLSDLAGIPDLFARIGPVLRSAAGAPGPMVRDLRPRVRALVTAWVLTTVAAAAVAATVLAVRLPALIVDAAAFVNAQCTLVAALMRRGELAGVGGLLRLAGLTAAVSGVAVPLLRRWRARGPLGASRA